MEVVSQQTADLLSVILNFKTNAYKFLKNYAHGNFPKIDIPLVTTRDLVNTLFYVLILGGLHTLSPHVTNYKLLAITIKVLFQTVPTFLYLLNLNPVALYAFVYNLVPFWARPYKHKCG